MKRDDAELEQLRARMTPEQRDQMAQLVAQEVRRRSKARAAAMNAEQKSQVKSAPISSKLSSDDLNDMYSGLSARIRKVRLESATKARHKGKSKPLTTRVGEFLSACSLSSKLKAEKMSLRAKRVNWSNDVAMPVVHFTLFSGVFTLGLLKLSMGAHVPDVGSLVQGELQANASVVYDDSFETPGRGRLSDRISDSLDGLGAEAINRLPEETVVAVSPHKEELLTRLDERRAELENRRIEIDRREQEISAKDKAVTLRISELKELTQKVEVQLKAREKDQADRLEQMANVYASMQPKDAATLLEKLDNEIALKLLAYLPGKRMGQILSLMDQSRAVELTKQLSGRKNAK